MIGEVSERAKKEIVYELDRRGRDAVSELALKFTRRPCTGKLIINAHEGRVMRVHFESSVK